MTTQRRERMSRLSREKLNELKEKYNTDRIWSFSRMNSYVNMPWEYYIKYVLRKKVDTSNAWTYQGTAVHDIIQDHIKGKYPHEKMLELFDELQIRHQIEKPELKFPSDSIKESYIENLRHYFKHIDYSDISDLEKAIELPIKAVFKDSNGQNILFIGYADLIYRENDKFYIVDFKTSSKGKFSGVSLEESAKQLKIYAIGLHQMFNVDYENIILRFDMQKYVKVSFLQKNGKWSKPTLQERREWVATQMNRINKLLTDNDVDLITATDMINVAIEENSLDSLPDYVQEKFKLDKGTIDVEMNADKAKETEHDVVSTIEEILLKEKSDNPEEAFPEPRLEDESFYLYNLAPGLLEYHEEYLNRQKIKESFVSSQSSILDDLLS